MTQLNTKKTILNAIKWLFGILFIIIGLGTIFKNSFIGGLLILIAGIIVIPKISDILKNRLTFWQQRPVRQIATIGILFVGMIITGSKGNLSKGNENSMANIDTDKQKEAINNYVKANKDKPLLKNLQLLEKWNNAFNIPENSNKIYYYSDGYTESYVEIGSKNGNTSYGLFLDAKKDKNISTIDYLKNIEGYGQLKNYSVEFIVNNENKVIKTIAKFKNDSDEVKEITDLNFDLSKYANLNLIKLQIVKAEKVISEREEKEAQERYKIELAEKRAKWEENCMSSYDGTCPKLVREFQPRLKDPDSFEHISTSYRKMDEYVIVSMKYRAKNSFNALDVGVVTAKISYDCEVIEFIE